MTIVTVILLGAIRNRIGIKRLTGQSTIDRDHQQICVATIADGLGNLYIEPICAGKPNSEIIYNTMHEKIDINATLITDEFHSYKYYTRTDKINHISVNSAIHVCGGYSLAIVNSVHSIMDEYISKDRQNQPATKYLDLYLVMFRWLYQRRKISISEKSNMLYRLITGNSDMETRFKMVHTTIAKLRARQCQYTIPTINGKQIVIN